nr:MerR family transcriptional regulator [Rhodococcus sp. (in: high G+C Gram-positive bacteria)]
MKIGELARLSGASVRSLRYYEELGLLEAQRSNAGAHRVYGSDAVDRVGLLRQLYSAGLSSTVIASILPCVDTPSAQLTRESITIMRSEYERLGEQMQTLAGARERLGHVISGASEHLRSKGECLPESG